MAKISIELPPEWIKFLAILGGFFLLALFIVVAYVDTIVLLELLS